MKDILGFPKNVFVLGLVSLFMDISSEMIYPLIPLYLNNVLHASKTSIGIIEGIAESTASILKVFSGWLSDRLGKMKGTGYGIYHTVTGLAALPSSIIGGALWQHIGPQALFFYGATMSLLSCILFAPMIFSKR